MLRIPFDWMKKIDVRKLIPAIRDLKAMLDERDYRKLEKLGAKKGIPICGMFLTREAFWPDGELIFHRRGRSHSVVRNYYNMVFTFANWKCLSDSTFGTGLLSIKDVEGDVEYSGVGQMLQARTGAGNTDIDSRGLGGLLAVAGDDTQGIVIGTGSGAESFEDYALGALIVNGSAGGEMDYSQSELHSITNSVLTLKDTLVRDFNNNSGGSITVEEAGIYVKADFYSTIFDGDPFMMTRDLTGGDAVADAAQYRVTYESTLTYPS